MTTLTQTQRVLKQLRQGRTLTSAQARTQGIQRLAARVHELRESGVRVVSTYATSKNGTRVVKYSLRGGAR
jgi:hypothetical protein